MSQLQTFTALSCSRPYVQRTRPRAQKHYSRVVSTNFPLLTLCIRSLQTGQATSTRTRDPFDAHPIADLDSSMPGSGAHFDNGTNALVAADLTLLGWIGEGGPRVFHDCEVAVADTGMCPTLAGYLSQ